MRFPGTSSPLWRYTITTMQVGGRHTPRRDGRQRPAAVSPNGAPDGPRGMGQRLYGMTVGVCTSSAIVGLARWGRRRRHDGLLGSGQGLHRDAQGSVTVEYTIILVLVALVAMLPLMYLAAAMVQYYKANRIALILPLL